jgi:hypothetical protein
MTNNIGQNGLDLKADHPYLKTQYGEPAINLDFGPNAIRTKH